MSFRIIPFRSPMTSNEDAPNLFYHLHIIPKRLLLGSLRGQVNPTCVFLCRLVDGLWLLGLPISLPSIADFGLIGFLGCLANGEQLLYSAPAT